MDLRELLHENGEPDERGPWARFLAPKLDRAFWIRLALLALVTFLVVRFVATPAFTHGASMVPTYAEREFLLIWHPVYWVRDPRVGDVVAVRYHGQKVMYFKRVVALEGQTVEFRDGRLFVDGQESTQYWNRLTPCKWNLSPRVVPPGHVYLVGDNRAMPMEEHLFGHADRRRLVGMPLW